MAKLAAVCAFLVVLAAAVVQTDADGEEQTLRRQKREWVIAPSKLMENVDYTHKEFIARIRSDEETRTTIQYSIEGHGANLDPVGLFTVDSRLGLVKIHGILDREATAVYNLRGVAKFQDGERAEKDIDLRIKVEDQNDCTPRFNIVSIGSVYELSQAGVFIINITAQDDDEPGTLHSQIAYSIVEQSPPGKMMFYIDQASGWIYVRMNALDREVQDTYKLTVAGADMNGQKNGNTGTGTVTIKVLDVNDNIPTLEKTFYEGSVEENIMNIEVIRIQAVDLDLMYTENWLAMFTIIGGNEAGYFSIFTDNKTNEGVLILNKQIDYEELQEISLKVTVSNVAKYHSSVVIREPTIYPIKIKVVNQPEGPRFQPSVKVISISEDSTTISLKKVIATYTAIDSDTLKIATNVRYVKGQDLDNWLIIDENTADIRLNKLPDRESKFLINGTYYAKILCITSDHPSKTATGTIAIQVEDFNDHCPVLTSKAQTICYGDNVVYVTATDRDEFPNAEPFLFKVVSQNSKVKWTVERLNDTTAILRGPEDLWPGQYTVLLEVQDQQGKFCQENQELYINMCSCDENKVCKPKKRTDTSTSFGAAGVLMMLLGLLLLLLIPLLLLFCLCGTAAMADKFKPLPSEQTQHLITYHTEGQGEDKDVPLLQLPTELGAVGGHGDGHGSGHGHGHRHEHGHGHGHGGFNGGHWTGGWGGGGMHGYFEQKDEWQTDHHDSSLLNNQYHQNIKGQGGLLGMGALEGIALSEAFLGSYYSKKAKRMTEQQAHSDSLLVYEYEGQASRRGSLEDICSQLHQEDTNLAFLNDLGPQFRHLAGLISGSSVEIGSESIKTQSKPQPVLKPAQLGTCLDVRAEGSAGISGGSTSATSASTSHVTMTTTDYHQSRDTSQIGTLTQTTTQMPGQRLLIQQPAMYYATTPIYMVEPQPQPTLLVTAGNVLDNVVLVDQRGADLVVPMPAPRASPRLGLKQSQTKVVVETQQGRGGAVVEGGIGVGDVAMAQGLLGAPQASSSSGSFRGFLETERLQTIARGSLHSGVGENRSRHVSGHANGHAGMLAEFASGSADSLEMPKFETLPPTLQHAGAQHKVREERISVVEKSFQTSSAT